MVKREEVISLSKVINSVTAAHISGHRIHIVSGSMENAASDADEEELKTEGVGTNKNGQFATRCFSILSYCI
jgi:hypothetical protein